MTDNKQSRIQELVQDINSMMQAKEDIQGAIDAAEGELIDQLYIETINEPKDIPE